MKECLECGNEFDDSKRTSEWWKKQFARMGVMADVCNICWKTEYHIKVDEK